MYSLSLRSLSIAAALVMFFLIITFALSKYSFGYEYEDTVVYTWYALDSDILESSKNFRTNIFENVNGNIERHPYSGHYITYGLYLKLFVSSVCEKRPDLIHKSANLLLITVLLVLLFYEGLEIQALLFLSLISTQYVIGSSLSENLSVFFGMLLLLSLRNSNFFASILFFVIVILIKRDSIIYIIPLIHALYLHRKLLFGLLTFAILVLYFVSVNPLHTEFIESRGLMASTFSFEIFREQFPYYLAFALSPLVTPVVFMRFSKNKVLFFTFVIGVLMYSAHYRSYFILNGLERFSEFHSWRYLYNLLPLVVVMELRFTKIFVWFLCIPIFAINIWRHNLLLEEEDVMYRSGEYIDSEFFIKSELNLRFSGRRFESKMESTSEEKSQRVK